MPVRGTYRVGDYVVRTIHGQVRVVPAERENPENGYGLVYCEPDDIILGDIASIDGEVVMVVITNPRVGIPLDWTDIPLAELRTLRWETIIEGEVISPLPARLE
jgi:hypothetical protein